MKYSELNEEQKKQARDWWLDLEIQDPAWLNEHAVSRQAALQAFKSGLTDEIIAKFEKAEITGYCDDCILHDVYKIWGENTTFKLISEAYNAAWKTEIKSRKVRKYIEEQIEANEYEFKLKVEIA
jgi:hypothetical protein